MIVQAYLTHMVPSDDRAIRKADAIYTILGMDLKYGLGRSVYTGLYQTTTF